MKKIILFLSVSGVIFACSHRANLRTASLIKNKKRSDYEHRGSKYMISTQGKSTTDAARFAFDNGGNIFDAATAATFAISVERPHSTGLGGGGFLLSNFATSGKIEAFDFREMAPRASHSHMFLDKAGKQVRDKSITGPLAIGTPGLVAGIVEIHKKYGKLPLAKVMQPAIKLAEHGFKIYPGLAKALKYKATNLCKFKASKEIFLKADCSPKLLGELLVQKDLASTLRLISLKGHDGFYKGSVAKKIIAHQKSYGGLMRMSDLDRYQVKLRKPIVGSYKGYKVVSMPPPSSGGAHIVQILNILEGYDLKSMGAQSSKAIHLTSSAMQLAFADRAEYMGDSDFKHVPVKTLISKKYAEKLRSKIKPDQALSSKDFPIPFKELGLEPDHTTHFTIMDSEGNVVSSTQTINGWFGSSMVADGTGVMMNNEMDDFASHVGGVNLFGAIGGRNNLVEPGKRPLSSMSPTIIYKDNSPILALGSPSGTRILTCVMQTALNVLEHDMSLWDAVAATRYHHQWSPEEIRVGDPGFSAVVTKELEAMGHKINRKNLGCSIQAIRRYSNKELHGVSDPRGEGSSFGI